MEIRGEGERQGGMSATRECVRACACVCESWLEQDDEEKADDDDDADDEGGKRMMRETRERRRWERRKTRSR